MRRSQQTRLTGGIAAQYSNIPRSFRSIGTLYGLGILQMMMTTTQRLLDLAAAAPASHDEDLVVLLSEASELYQQGFEDLRDTVADRFAGLSPGDVAAAATAAGMPCDVSQDRDELLVLLALAEWEMTPAALAYTEMAEDAARRGVCLIPEE